MLFGSISYLNLLPFHCFIKQHLSHNASRMSFSRKRAVPSQINHDLARHRIDAGFISSIESQKYRCSDVGIIAHKRVYSVLLLQGVHQDDPASASSNQLAKILHLQGRVLIGDEALKHYLLGKQSIDLAYAWYTKHQLPFVFARLCYTKHSGAIKKLARSFAHKRVKIPQYILKKEANKRGISPKELQWYLRHIHYNIDHQAKRSLKRFLNEASKV
jgi:chorismate dehydratase